MKSPSITAIFLVASASLVAASPMAGSIGKICWLASGIKGVCRANVGPEGCPGGTFESSEGAKWPCYGSSNIQCCVFDPIASDTTPSEGDGHMNRAGINLLKVVEGIVLHIYSDQRGVPTIGIGRNCGTGEHVCPQDITIEQAEGYLAEDLVRFEQKICSLPNANKLNQNQFSALVSYAFNVGEFGAYDDLYPYMASGDFEGLGKNLVNMKPIDNRRRAERELYFTSTGTTSGCSPAYA